MTARCLFGSLCLCACAIVATPAAAQSCESDDDCEPGLACTDVESVDCTRPTCPEGDTCDAMPECEPTTIKQCGPKPCMDDSECPTDMVCYAHTYTECSGGGTASGGASGGAEDPAAGEPVDAGVAEPTEPECTETTESYCAPKYVPPCEVDDDCGPGFTCEEIELCACSGSSGSAGDSAGGAAGAAEGGSAGSSGEGSAGEGSAPDQGQTQECTCEPTGEFYCKLIAMTCADASDCPEGFSCETDPELGICRGDVDVAGTGGASGSMDGASVDGGTASGDGVDAGPADDPCANTSDASKVCLPPYWNVAVRGGEPGGGVPVGEGDGKTSGTGSDDMSAGGAGQSGGEPSVAEHAKSKSSGGLCTVSAVGNARGRTALLPLLLALGWLARRRTT